LGDPP
jgi:hypothetical protein